YNHRGRLKGRHISAQARARNATSADTSADTFPDGVAVGAASHVSSLILVQMYPNQSYRELMHNLQCRGTQTPPLGSSHVIVWFTFIL
ncbi:hypothetical protein FB45DRAFT_936006, partial [Roridomyces roridus]